MHFFSPVIHWSGPKGDGKTCTSECPLLYYFVACLWRIFGYHEFIFRLLNTFIAFSGLYALFNISKEFLKDEAWALVVSLLLFSSTIFAYYANNYIVDTSAFSFALISWFFFQKFYVNGKIVFFNFSLLFFLIAGLIKITALLSFVPIFLAFLIEAVNVYKFKGNDKIFKRPILYIAQFLFVFLVIYLWTNYAINYNRVHMGGIFSTGILPIWEPTTISNYAIFNQLCTVLLHEYLPPYLLLSVIIIFISIVLLHKKINKFLLFLTCAVFVECIVYILLWFQVFYVHDYYLMNLLIFFSIVILTFLDYLRKYHFEIFKSTKLKAVAFVVLLFCIYHCAVQLSARYSTDYTFVRYNIVMDDVEEHYWEKEQKKYKQYFQAYETITPYLRSIGIKRDDKVISIPDNSPNISLYLMDQKGYTDFGYGDSGKENKTKELILSGVKYLIINDSSYVNKDWIKPFITRKIGVYHNILIYDVEN